MSAVEAVGRSLAALHGVVAEHHGLAAALDERALRHAEVAGLPLAGAPFAVKDAFAAWGAPTTWGSPYFRHRRFDEDAEVIQRLEAAGGVLTAKLAMSELAGYGGPARAGSSLQGTALNPWNRSCYAGGSSGGSAIAVALGAVAFALGTETAGSVVGPAALCGVTGFRPTPGRISRAGMLVLSPTLDKPGVLARTARQCADVFAIVRTPDAPTANGTSLPRVGVASTGPGGWAPGADELLVAALDELSQLSKLVCVGPDEMAPQRANAALRTIMLYEAGVALGRELDDERFRLLDPQQDAGLRAGARIPAVDYQAALAERRRVRADFVRLFDRCDVLVCASRSDTARPLGAGPTSGGGSVADRLRAAANLAGLPGVSIPCGLSKHGLPVGLHLVGPPGGDEQVLDLAAAFQARTTHHLLRPPVAPS